MKKKALMVSRRVFVGGAVTKKPPVHETVLATRLEREQKQAKRVVLRLLDGDSNNRAA